MLQQLRERLRLKTRLNYMLDHIIEGRRAARTEGVVLVPDLGLVGPNAGDAVRYEATPTALFIRLIRSLNLDYSKFALIDLGSGKGRILLRSAEMPFSRIEGVELSEALYRDSIETIIAAGIQERVTVRNVDAVSYDFPPVPFVLFMFNPFGERVMRQVVANLVRSLEITPRDIFVIYLNAKHAQIFDETGVFIQLTRSGPSAFVERLLSPWPIAVFRYSQSGFCVA